MNLSDFDFNLPDELIAQEPSSERDRSRLMVLNRKGGEIEHHSFFEIADYLKPGDLLVINNTKVIPARLMGKKATGRNAEVFLLERVSGREDVWECLVGAKRVKSGLVVTFNDSFSAEVIEELGDGRFNVRFHSDRPFEDVLEEVGQVPLPPYIKRGEGQGAPPLIKGGTKGGVDKERYQTVFAEKKGAVAAPTAGLHFTKDLLKKIRNKGIEIVPITLHVGPGTFLPVKTENIEEHRMLPERYEISSTAADKINRAKAEGRRVIAVGSTSMRAIEASVGDSGFVKEGKGKTSIFIYPPYKFKVVDLLITNFHLPKSTLIMLVSAFASRELIFKAYREAIEQKYRFYSYGDAMMIL